MSTTAYETASLEVAEADSGTDRPTAYFVRPPAGTGNVIRCACGADGTVRTTAVVCVGVGDPFGVVFTLGALVVAFGAFVVRPGELDVWAVVASPLGVV